MLDACFEVDWFWMVLDVAARSRDLFAQFANIRVITEWTERSERSFCCVMSRNLKSHRKNLQYRKKCAI